MSDIKLILILLSNLMYLKKILYFSFLSKKEVFLSHGGENGIRTHDTVSRIHAFQACAFNHSATSPNLIAFYLYFFYIINQSK